jgi:predicted nucleotidyltransferase
MQTIPAQEQFDIGDLHDELEKVYRVSAYLDFPFTIDEVTNYFLPRSNVSSKTLRSLLINHEFPDLPFKISDDYLLTKAEQSTESRSERERMSAEKLISAASFGSLLAKAVPFVRTVAVTGSVAYGSAGKWDDIDLFIVTKRKRLWTSATLVLTLVRLVKLLNLRPPHLSLFCLSYVHDEQGFAIESNRSRTNPLFARELLKAQPVAGAQRYRKYLEENVWVRDFYASAYFTKLKELQGNHNGVVFTDDYGCTSLSSFFADWAEGVAFVLLSRYLRLRAYMMNLKLKSGGNNLRVFEPVISASSCVYTSNFYRWLSAIWGQ